MQQHDPFFVETMHFECKKIINNDIALHCSRINNAKKALKEEAWNADLAAKARGDGGVLRICLTSQLLQLQQGRLLAGRYRGRVVSSLRQDKSLRDFHSLSKDFRHMMV